MTLISYFKAFSLLTIY